MKIAAGGEIGVRVSDTAGNLGSHESVAGYTVYLGDGYAGTFTATGSKVLYAGEGNDTITVSGSSNTVYGQGDNDIITVSGTSNVIYGGDNDDTITVTGASNTVSSGNGEDSITISASSGTVDAGDGDNDVTLSVALSGFTGTITAGDNILYGDKLRLTSEDQSLDLSSVISKVSGFEKIYLSDDTSMVISPTSALAMTDTSILRIDGDDSNTLFLDGTWMPATVIDLIGYSAYRNSSSTIYLIFNSDIKLGND